MKTDKLNECYSCVHKRAVTGSAHIQCLKPDADMKGYQHGINNGWFHYPSLYDPIWKETKCKNYENREQVSATGESA